MSDEWRKGEREGLDGNAGKGFEDTNYWLEILVDAGIVSAGNLADLIQEANELTAMLVSSAKTTKERSEASPARRSNRTIRKKSS